MAVLTQLLTSTTSTFGVFTTRDARTAGVSAKRLVTLHRNGVIEPLHRGVWRFTGNPVTWEAKVYAAVRAAGDEAAASRGAAAKLLGIKGVPFGGAEVTLVGDNPPHLEKVRCHCTKVLDAIDRTTVRGIACTTGARTLIDVAHRLGWDRAVAAADNALCAGACERSTLFARAVALRPGRPGCSWLVDITAPEAEGVFWSALERGFAVRLGDTGLPMPLFNAPIRDGARTLFADALWPRERVIAELNGLAFHRLPEHKERDADRLNEFLLLGYRPFTFGWQEVMTSFDHVAATLASALRAPTVL